MNKKIVAIVTATALSTTLFAGMALAKPAKGGSHGHSKGSSVHSSKDSAGKSFASHGKSKSKGKINAEIRENVKEHVKQKLKAKKVERKLSELSDIENHWAKDSIERLQLMGVVGGYEDGTFKPENEVTETEAISLVMRLFGDIDIEDDVDVANENDESNTNVEDIQEDNDEEEQANDTEDVNVDEDKDGQVTEDVDDNEVEDESELSNVPQWAHEPVTMAAKKKIINMNRFHSHVQATRAQAAVWIAKAMDMEPMDTSQMQFNDGILISPEDAGYIMALVDEGIIRGTSDGNFNPNSAITRAEMAVILDRILQEETEVQDSEENADNTEVSENTDADNSSDEEVSDDNSSDEGDTENTDSENVDSEQ